jgi:rfaE bifunctional protein kinase chain/domain/rfaE bifunctional protein nucleotidyltransferase chain/domain
MPSSDKIMSLDALASVTEAARAAGKTIVHCHGVFDLLHIGHIKHFQAARQLGDLLIVTITPDHLVDKGPHRPMFPDQLRAEALASLECVDCVAINKWPSAVETIRLLKPHFFVKGATDETGPRDQTGAIEKEEEAVKAIGGQLHLTQENTFSASALINRYSDLFSPEVRLYLEAFRARYSEDDVFKYLRDIAKLKILTIGETIIDEYYFCDVMNKANKDPILAAKLKHMERYLGGIQAINNHLAGFAGHLTCLTALGSHDTEEAFIRENLNANVDLHFINKADGPTIVKRRYLEEHLSMKLLETDAMNDDPLIPPDEAAFIDMIASLAPQHDIVIVADYGHGLMTERVIEVLCEKARFLAVNVQVNPGNYGFNLVSRYPRADFVTIDENEARLEMKKKHVDIQSIAQVLATQLKCRSFLLTRGQHGTVGYDERTGFSRTPVFSVKLVDRIGAGDACQALTAPCAVLGAPTEILGFIGNVAGAAACAIIGNKSYLEPVSYFRNVSSLLK